MALARDQVNIGDLPDEMLSLVLGNLSANNLLAVREVCRGWKDVPWAILFQQNNDAATQIQKNILRKFILTNRLPSGLNKADLLAYLERLAVSSLHFDIELRMLILAAQLKMPELAYTKGPHHLNILRQRFFILAQHNPYLFDQLCPVLFPGMTNLLEVDFWQDCEDSKRQAFRSVLLVWSYLSEIEKTKLLELIKDQACLVESSAFIPACAVLVRLWLKYSAEERQRMLVFFLSGIHSFNVDIKYTFVRGCVLLAPALQAVERERMIGVMTAIVDDADEGLEIKLQACGVLIALWSSVSEATRLRVFEVIHPAMTNPEWRIVDSAYHKCGLLLPLLTNNFDAMQSTVLAALQSSDGDLILRATRTVHMCASRLTDEQFSLLLPQLVSCLNEEYGDFEISALAASACSKFWHLLERQVKKQIPEMLVAALAIEDEDSIYHVLQACKKLWTHFTEEERSKIFAAIMSNLIIAEQTAPVEIVCAIYRTLSGLEPFLTNEQCAEFASRAERMRHLRHQWSLSRFQQLTIFAPGIVATGNDDEKPLYPRLYGPRVMSGSGLRADVSHDGESLSPRSCRSW